MLMEAEIVTFKVVIAILVITSISEEPAPYLLPRNVRITLIFLFLFIYLFIFCLCVITICNLFSFRRNINPEITV
jgi:hypothetical protein